MNRRNELQPAQASLLLTSGALFLALSLALSAGLSQAGVEPMLETSTSWDGGKLVYPSGDARVTAVILRIEEGETPPFHCHPVPTMGYVLKGAVEVETKSGKKAIFKAGESVVEVLGTVHRGVAVQAPVEIVVFYAGAEGVPNTVLPEDDPDGDYCEAF